jgi:RNA polymerase sigma-70 factor (ECF subfamily)
MGAALDPRSRTGFAQAVLALGPAHAIFGRRALDEPGEAEDVLQTALTSAFSARRRFEPGSSFRAWIYSFAHGATVNANRRRRVRLALVRPAEEPPEPPAADTLETELAYEEALAAPEALLERIDARLAGALRSLNEPEREAILLRAVAELSVTEIAGVCGVPAGTVMARLFRARTKLRTRLAAPGTERRPDVVRGARKP